jgi:hypothetical protein
MKDVIVVVPTILAGAVILFAASEASWHRPGDMPTYLLFLAFLFGILLLWYRSKLKAAERGRAAEVRRPAATAEPMTPMRAVAVVGVGTPVGVCALAWFASLTTHTETEVVWFVAGLISVTALVCGTYLLTRLAGSPFAQADRPARNGWHKPDVSDPDAIDLVGRRG